MRSVETFGITQASKIKIPFNVEKLWTPSHENVANLIQSWNLGFPRYLARLSLNGAEGM